MMPICQSPNHLSATAQILTQRKPLSILSPNCLGENKNRISNLVHCCAYYAEYFGKVYGGSKKYRDITHHREIAKSAIVATNALASLWVLTNTLSSSEVYTLNKEISLSCPRLRDALCRGVAINRHPRKTTPLKLALALSHHLSRLATYAQYLPSPECGSLAKEASQCLSAMVSELHELRIETGWLPRWPKLKSQLISIEA